MSDVACAAPPPIISMFEPGRSWFRDTTTFAVSLEHTARMSTLHESILKKVTRNRRVFNLTLRLDLLAKDAEELADLRLNNEEV